MVANPVTERQLVAPVFEHPMFPVGLGFVAGFVDIFGFMSWYGLLAAHVTGNLIFLAVDIAHGRYDLVMKLLALPIFTVSVAVSAWFIGALIARGRHPFAPVIIAQAALLAACLVTGLVMPPPRGPDDWTAVVAGSIALLAMALQNATMRLILNNLPATTVMTGNLTNAVSEVVRWLAGYGRVVLRGEIAALARSAKLIGSTLAAFTAGAIAGGLAQVQVGYVGLLLPIAVLLALLPFGQATLRAAKSAPTTVE